MASTNPAINPPNLRAAIRSSLHSRSPSRSPVRHARELDPLLRDLSPTATLQAFSAVPSHVPSGSNDILAKSVETASSSERALGAKAARTCLDLRSWTRELESWEWPGTFDVPTPARKKIRMSAMNSRSVVSGHTTATIPEEDEEDWGSLSAQTVQAYEHRTDEIGRELDQIDFEELKDYVLSAHQIAGSGPPDIDDSIGAIGAATDLRMLDDFTAVVTATILHTLPYLSRLYRLLDTWTIRLSILRQAPGYLEELKQARTDLDHGWAAIAVPPSAAKGPDNASFRRATMQRMRNALEIRVSNLGRRLDRFLDEVEGRQETIPDNWIEDFETLEHAYGVWVVQAERKVLEDELRTSRNEKELQATHAEAERLPTSEDAEVPRPSISKVEKPSEDGDLPISPMAVDVLDPDKCTNSHLPGTVTSRKASSTHIPHNGAADDPKEPKTNVQPVLPPIDELQQSATKHTRHVPIVIDYEAANKTLQDHMSHEENPLANASNHHESITLVPEPEEPLSESQLTAVKKRAALLAGERDKQSSLHRQSKTPVRPFEHATNAFTRLFKRSSASPEGSRSNSTKSGTSSKHSSISTSRTSELSSDRGIVWSGRTPLGGLSSDDRKVNMGRMRTRSSSAKGRSAPVVTYTHQDGVKVVTRDYVDLPGGLPRRFSEDSSRQPRSQPRSEFAIQGPQRPVPETYQPKRLSSPFRELQRRQEEQEPEYPADWPLASPPEPGANSPIKEVPTALPEPQPSSTIAAEVRQTNDVQERSAPETMLPNQPIQTESFDRLFVQSLPNTPNERSAYVDNPFELPVSIPPRSSSATQRRGKRGSRPKSRSVVSTLDELMLSNASAGGWEKSEQKSRFDGLKSSWQMPVTAGMGARDSAVFGSYNSDVTSNGVRDVKEVGYFRTPISAPTAGSPEATEIQRPKSSPSAKSPVSLKLEIPTTNAEAGASDDEAEDKKPGLIHRASVASIESHPRSELKRVDVTRRSSASSSAPQTPAREKGYEPTSAVTPSSFQGLIVFPSPPRSGNRMPTSPVSPVKVSPQWSRWEKQEAIAAAPLVVSSAAAESPVVIEEGEEPAPLNAAMVKRHGRAVLNGKPVSPRKPIDPLKPGEDSFDRHVSEVLESLPASINFKPRSGTDTPVPRTSEPRSYPGPRPNAKRFPSKTGSSDLTLAPAGPSPRKAATNEPEVKLYHLTQQGRDEPIKLFVRLVGEGERVMVRVGGGWADLADYLRQYAEHHGSRTVSSSGIEVQTVENNGNGKRSVSGPAPTKRPVTPITSGPGWLKEPQPRFSMGDGSTPTDDEGSPVYLPQHQQTPTDTIATQRSTPRSIAIKGSRPSTSDSNARPTSRQSWTETNMAGPANGKRGDLSEQKQKWVEGMIEKAKQASVEKNKGEREQYFGELGNVGGTRRVIFRQSSAGGDEK